MPFPSIKKTIDYVNFNFYSTPMTVFNIQNLEIPCPIALDELNYKHYRFLLRTTHGLPHVLPAMELVENIFNSYLKIEGYSDHFKEIANALNIGDSASYILLQYIKIAVLFHDSGRKGNNMDLWDEDSADACLTYLVRECGVKPHLAVFIADTIRYKDNENAFKGKYNHLHLFIDYIRQLVNMADTLEVIRTRNTFKPDFLPISQSVSAKIMHDEVIPELVVAHRTLVFDQGRLSQEGKIKFEKEGQKYHDSALPRSGKDKAKMAKAYYQYAKKYEFVLFDIQNENLEEVFSKVQRGIKRYLAEYSKSGIQWTHNGFFSPRYHGELGVSRAKYYEFIFNTAKNSSDKLKALYALLASHDGKTLQETILNSFGHHNKQLYLSQISTLIKQQNPTQNVAKLNLEVEGYLANSTLRAF